MKPNYLINSFNMNLFITCWVLENNQQKQKSQNEYERKKERKKEKPKCYQLYLAYYLFICHTLYAHGVVTAQCRAYTCVRGVY